MPIRHATTDYRDTPCVRLHNDGATALVALHGGQLLSWMPEGGHERLFLAERADFASGAAIRGGVPVIFPQFGDRGALRKHGFARLLDWTFLGIQHDAALFELRDGPATANWAHAFACRLSIVLTGTALAATLDIENCGDSAFAFTAALHTYLRVRDLAQVTLQGLQGCDYEDSANGGTLHRESGQTVVFGGEIDRIYGDVVAPLLMVDGEDRLRLEQRGFGDAIVWNPGETLAAGIGDLASGEHRRFVCVEAGQVLQPVTLLPGERWCGTQVLG